MPQSANPSQIAAFLRAVADGIDRSKNPDRNKVASDLKCVLAALNGEEGAVARVAAVASASQKPAAPAPAPYKISFTGSVSPDNLRGAAEEILKRRPALAGQKVRVTLIAEPVGS